MRDWSCGVVTPVHTDFMASALVRDKRGLGLAWLSINDPGWINP